MALLRSLRFLLGRNQPAVLVSLFVLLGVSVPTFSLAAGSISQALHSPTPAVPTSGAASQAQAMTRSLLGLYARYAAASTSDKPRLQLDLIAAARDRYVFLGETLDEDPASALGAVLPASTRSRLPAFLGLYLEQNVRIEGTLEILHEDWLDASQYRYFINGPAGRYSVHFAQSHANKLLSGARVALTGIQVATMLAIDSSDTTSVQQLSAAPTPQPLGAQSTLVILVNFSDAPAQPYTADSVRVAMFAGDGYTINHFYLENSFQKTWLTGDVAGWYTIAATSISCDTSTIATQAQAAASAAGFDLTAYAHQVYAFPENSACGWAGLSSVGGYPSQSWINSINGAFQTRVVAHEIGHGLGLWHSHSLDCGASVIGTNCTTAEYGDVVDTMGGPIGFAPAAHFTSFQKERLGWLNAGSAPPITTVSASGTYAIDVYETVGTGPKALKILKSTDAVTGQRTWYYVEYRQALGFDAFLSGLTTNILAGILIHTGSEASGDSSDLLDLTPSTDTWWDSALATGQTFQDPNTGLILTATSVSGMQAAVTVTFAPISVSTPTVTISTDRTTYLRGQTATVTAQVTMGGAPIASASVAFSIVKANGTKTTATALTGGAGTVSFKLRLRKQDPVGLYQATAQASVKGQAASAMTTFDVD